MESDNMKEIFRECLRNHAANLGSYATDGCGEFIPDETSAGGLQCAACGCHRNFHRKVLMVASAAAGDATILPGRSSSAAASESVKKRFRTKFSAEQKEKMLQFAEKIGWRLQKREDSDGDDDRDEEIEQFCREIGVSRQVFKVWLHNHRNSSSSSSSLTH